MATADPRHLRVPATGKPVCHDALRCQLYGLVSHSDGQITQHSWKVLSAAAASALRAGETAKAVSLGEVGDASVMDADALAITSARARAP